MTFHKIINANCFEVFPKMKDKCVDFVLTSPPFKDEDIPTEYYSWLKDLLTNLERVTKNYSFIFNSSKRLKEICKRFEPERILVWAKVGLKTAYRYEPIFVFNHGSELNINSRIWGDCPVIQPILNPEVPYSNPLKLYRRLICMLTEKGDVILDPFLGSGTTMVACKLTGRSCVGIEKNPEYYKIAQEWVDKVKPPKKLAEVFG